MHGAEQHAMEIDYSRHQHFISLEAPAYCDVAAATIQLYNADVESVMSL